MLTRLRQIVATHVVWGYAVLLFSLACVPLFFDNRTIDFFIVPKQLIFYVLLIIQVLLAALVVTTTKQVTVRGTIIDKPIAVLIGISLLAAFFSFSPLVGLGGRTDHFFVSTLLWGGFALFYWLLVHHLTTAPRVRTVIDVFVGVGGLTALFFLGKALLSQQIPWFSGMWNTIDTANSAFGFWLVAVVLTAAAQLLKKELATPRGAVYTVSLVASLAGLFLLNYKTAWWLLFVGLGALVVVGISCIREVRQGILSAVFALFLIVGACGIFGVPKSFERPLPAEITLNTAGSWNITRQALFAHAKNVLIGGGAGSFAVSFSEFRDPSFNYDPLIWSARFNRPSSSVFSLLTEMGVFGFLAFLFIVLVLALYVLRVWLSKKIKIKKDFVYRRDALLLAVPWLTITIGLAFLFYNFVLWWVWWLFTALLVIGLSEVFPDLIRERQKIIEDKPEYNVSFSFALIILAAASLLALISGARLYRAEKAYAFALRSSNYDVASQKLQEAITLRSATDSYHLALSQINFLEAVRLIQAPQPNVEKIKQLMGQALVAARRAATLSPQSVQNWENLATMAENIAATFDPQARDLAIEALEKAKKLEPSNPQIVARLGVQYASQGAWPQAITFYQNAIALKNDYFDAYAGLANAYEKNNEPGRAIELLVGIAPRLADKPDMLFNYARLLYNRNQKDDHATAEKMWLYILQTNLNHTNALYSLGLLYENRGDKRKALDYYYQVQSLVPTNKDVNDRIKRLSK